MSLVIVLLVLAACAAATIHLGRGFSPGTIAAALVLAGLMLLLPLGLDPAIVVDRGRLWLYTALFAAPVVAALGVWAHLRKADGATPLAKLLLFGAIGSLLTGLCLLRVANMALDGGAPTPYTARIEALESVSGRRGRTWHADIGGVELPNVRRLRIDEDQYARLRIGMPVDVLVHDGALGIRWVSAIAPAADGG